MAMKAIYGDVLTKNYLMTEYITNRRSASAIAKDVGCRQSTVLRYLRIHRLNVRPTCIRRDIAGETFGSLTAIEAVGKKGKAIWRCKCVCGNSDFVIDITRLVCGITSSCGCQSKGRRNGNYRGTPHISKTYWNTVQRGAAERGYEFTITIDDAEAKLVSQEFRCALTGLPLQVCESRKIAGEWTASLDRIDSSKGYIHGNIQWIHKDVNRMKWHFDEDYFVALCSAVYHHRGQPNDNHNCPGRKEAIGKGVGM